MRNNPDIPQKARNYAFLLLKFRLRSCDEVYQRLKRKKFSEEVIKDTLSFLKSRGFIDDIVFARAWLDSRIKRSLGLRRIRQELILKGVGKDIIDASFAELKNSYSEEAIVGRLARGRLDKLKNVDLPSTRRRLYAYLLRRGFQPQLIQDAIKSLCKQTS